MFQGGYDIKLSDDIRRKSQRKLIEQERQNRKDQDYYNKLEKERPWEAAAKGFATGHFPDDQDHGIDPDGEYGVGDLIFAAGQGNLKRVRQLVEYKGSNPHRAKWSGVTALHRAAGEGKEEVVLYLLKSCKVDPNAKTTFGWHTPLHFACRGGHEDTCVALLENGATWAVHNKDRETPQQWARLGGHANMGRKVEQLVNQQASKHRKAKVAEMERVYAERRKKQEEERRLEDEEAKRLEEAEEAEAQRQAALAAAATERGRLDKAHSEPEAHRAHSHTDPNNRAQLPVNLPAITYTRRGRKSTMIYNSLINRSVIVDPLRFGHRSDYPSVYVTRNKVHMPGVTDTGIKAVGELSRHMRKTRRTRDFRMTADVKQLIEM